MRNFAFIIIFITSSQLFSQINIYKPFPEVYAQWEVEKSGPYGPGSSVSFSWKKYEVVGDTTIGAYTYKNVYGASSTGNPIWNGTQYVIPYGPSSFSFGYRNDTPNKKVYLVYVTSGGINSDVIWYDFNLNIGDTLKNTFSFINPTGYSNNPRRIVQSIDSILICGIYHKKFNFSCFTNPFDTYLIEGCGFSDLFIKTYFTDCPFEPEYVYGTEFSTCISNSIDEIDKTNSSLTIYPNPTSDNLSVNNGTAQILDIRVYDIKGSEVLKSDESTINIGTLSKGLYLIKVKTDKGEFSQKFIKE